MARREQSEGEAATSAAPDPAAENARLARELAEAREQQAATSQILQAIAKAPADLRSVLDAITATAARLCRADKAHIRHLEDGLYRVKASFGHSAEEVAYIERHPVEAGRGTLSSRAALDLKTIHVPDVLADPEWTRPDLAQVVGLRTGLGVPLLREGKLSGVLILARTTVAPFTAREIEMAETFAAQAVIAIENTRLFGETATALERETAMSSVLRIISGSPTDLRLVLDAIAENAARLCATDEAIIWRRDGDVLRLAAGWGTTPNLDNTLPVSRRSVVGRALHDRAPVHVPDLAAVFASEFPESRRLMDGGYRSLLAAPLLRQGEAIGVIIVRRGQVRPYTEPQIALLRTFADQAVIAIENTRLFEDVQSRNRDLLEALEQQTATGEILGVIASSPADLKPVLDVVVTNAARLCAAYDCALVVADGDTLRELAHHGPIPFLGDDRFPLTRASVMGRAVLDGRLVHIPDLAESAEFPEGSALARQHGNRTTLAAPLLREGKAFGALVVRRKEVRPFSDKQIALLQSFADQAVIAIENTRLFEQVQARTRELTESLEYQTAMSEVLGVISRSPKELQPVLDAMLKTAARLCEAEYAMLFKRGDDGRYHVAGANNAAADYVKHAARHPLGPGRGSLIGRTALERQPVHLPDCLADPEYTALDYQRVGLHRSMLGVPLLRDGDPIGVISLLRNAVKPFTVRQIELVSTFADQAVIAINNVGLFEEVQARTRDLAESLEYQTATSEVLGVISRSPTDVQPVLDAVVRSAARLCEADFAIIRRRDGETYPIAASVGLSAAQHEHFTRYATTPDRGSIFGRAIIEGRAIHVPDVLADPEFGRPQVRQVVDLRSGISVPLMREGAAIGVITVFRRQPRAFSQRQIDLVATFADQAVIAIENARLFNETREALERQTAMSEVLRIISTSPTDLQPVLEAIARNAARLCDVPHAHIWGRDGDELRHLATSGEVPPLFRLPVSRGSVVGRALLDREPVHVEDLAAVFATEFPDAKGIMRRGGRTVLALPLLREGEAIGVIIMRRTEVRPFTEAQIALLRAFADQAVIAIENTRLFEEVQSRNRDLTESLEQQTATAEVLGVIARSPTDLKPVLDVVVENAARLCGAYDSLLTLVDGESLREVAHYGPIPSPGDERRALTRGTVSGRAVLESRAVHIHDILDAEDFPEGRARGERFGFRTTLAVPLLRDGKAFGVLLIRRAEVRPFTDRQIELLQTFADQAVIAIENARLFNETKEALDRQTAMSEVLRIISTSPSDLEPVLNAIARNAARLCATDDVFVWLRDGETLRQGAAWSPIPLGQVRLPNNRQSPAGRAVQDRRPVHVQDFAEVFATEFPDAPALVKAGYRSVLAVPLLGKAEALGAIVVRRHEIRPFTDAQIELLQTFADQAVIAIENTRLFGELQARTSELSEALERQTATSEVLTVISRSATDLQPVLDTIVATATRLCQADWAVIFKVDGGKYRVVADSDADAEFVAYMQDRPFTPDRGTLTGRVMLEGKAVQIEDAATDPEYTFPGQKLGRYRSMLGVPLMRDGVMIGNIALLRAEVLPFTATQIDLVTTFADQAVIAINNVELFEEVQARTEDLAESLRQQTATADVLKVISRSTFDLQTVLRSLLETAVQLCEADQGTITRERDGKFYRAEAHGFAPEFLAAVRDIPIQPDRGSASGRALLEGRIVHIPDIREDPEFTFAEAKALGGFRTIVAVPMMKEGAAIGVLVFTRHEPRPFTDKQIELVSTFADQAAIAIENVRLFESVEARTRELARSLEELRAAQDRLVQTEKLASLGQLTAGIAHEIKNPLNFVNNFAALSVELIGEMGELLQSPDLDADKRAEIAELAGMVRGNLEKVTHHGQRADSIVKNMLLHSRSGSGDHRPVDINAVVEESLNLAYHGARAERRDFNVTLERSLDPAAGKIDLYPQEITRVLLNLISNGFYAASRRKAEGGEPGFEPVLRAATRDLGDRVEISIRDNGTGIPPDVREKIFNPFFTTKPPGEGTGLGLSLSHDIVVKQHAGSIDVDTEAGRFTEFRIVLPRAAASIAKAEGRA